MDAMYIVQIAHGHDSDSPATEYWVSEDQARSFALQISQPQSPFVRFVDKDGVMRGYNLGDIRYFEVRTVEVDAERRGANVIDMYSWQQGRVEKPE